MYSKRTTIINETGIHARPAAEFIQASKKFACKVTVSNVTSGGVAVNAKSLVRIMGEEFTKGSVIEISADGEGEQEAVETLAALVDSGLGE
jgi:phosphocarrier protein